MTQQTELCHLGLAVIETEAAAISALSQRIDAQFAKACEYLLACRGRIVVTGMGKSGHIASKIAATLASTGSPAFYVHPGEASHGDMGMITRDDVVIALSNSGETGEIITLLPLLNRLGVPIITLSGNPEASLAKAATINLDVSVEKEACPLGLAPTASSTASLVMGDALAIALLQARGFTAEDFALSHPGGSLGRRLLLHVADIMHHGDDLPTVTPNTSLADALVEITQKKLGMTCITQGKEILGVFTDGDLRRALDDNCDIHQTSIDKVMSREFKSCTASTLAASALQLMEDHRITALVVLDEHNHLSGILHMHDLLRAGVI